MSAVGLGVGALLVFTLTLPLFESSEGETPEPVVAKDLLPGEPTESRTTLRDPNAPVATVLIVKRN